MNGFSKQIIDYQGKNPKIGKDVFIAPDAWIIGDVQLGELASVYFGSVLRGDILPIVVGSRSNIQEQTIVHTQTATVPTIIGEDVTVGHRATLHSCKIGNRCLIGMGSIILDRAEIGEDSIVAAGSLVTIGRQFPPRSLIMGAPAKAVRELTTEEIQGITQTAERYIEKSQWYRGRLGI